MQKRGQVQSNMIMFALLAVVVGLILLLGYKSIYGLSENTHDAELLQFKNTLQSDVSTLAPLSGNEEMNNYDMPSGVGYVCLVDLLINKKGSVSAGLKQRFPTIANEIEGETNNNLFLFDTKEEYLDSSSIGELRVNGPGWICYTNQGGKLVLELRSTGNEVDLKKDFSDKKELIIGSETILEIEEIPGLKANLTPSGGVTGQVFARLKVDKVEGASLTDNVYIDTLDLNDGDYTADTVIFSPDSYIEIPITNCALAGTWAGRNVDSCSDGIAKYSIGSI